tara:strand:+ start:997 stop:1359 length:363 start_codon:yes stop_codon:yes gene_type:complete
MISGANAHAAEMLEPVAKKGQVIVIYRGPCPSGKTKAAMKKIEKIISYERKNSPVRYSSSPGNWEDGQIGAVDLHASQSAMEKAFAWQESDKKWSKMYDDVAKICGTTVEEFHVHMLTAN